jgi:hypothetical protein
MKCKAVFLIAACAALLAACSTPMRVASQGEPSPSEASMSLGPDASSGCDTVTGSRVTRRADGECRQSSYPFRSFSKEDLERTGSMELGDQLRDVDPAFAR